MHYFIWSRSVICGLDMFTYIYLRMWKLIWLASWPVMIGLESRYDP